MEKDLIGKLTLCSVRHTEGTSFYLGDDLILDVDKEAIVDFAGCVEYPVHLENFVNQLNSALTKFGYEIFKKV